MLHIIRTNSILVPTETITVKIITTNLDRKLQELIHGTVTNSKLIHHYINQSLFEPTKRTY
ncbi:hypothetical protein SAMN04488008_10832 [Maribacter orientalis]|uniref:Uncharacterized protein n=1 Tax=Maribacter orientalis TaxID=228957 RepID=A0A1H7UY98_9FLAO|nr:hypothetical protein SAMN04488008_10832 [Maribacter orientalis]